MFGREKETKKRRINGEPNNTEKEEMKLIFWEG